MKQDHLIKQAYVRGLAARGLLRQYVIKAAETDTGTAALKNVRDTANKAFAKGRDIATDAIGQAANKDSWKDYAIYGGVGALGGGALGALIQAARQKEMFPGIAIGSGIGGTLGLGTRAALNVLNTTGVLGDERLEAAKDAVRSGMGAAKDYTNQGMDQANSWWNDNKDMVKNIAMSGGIGAAGGSIIGALIQAAREKNILLGAGVGGGLGGIAGAGVGAAPYITEFVKKKQEEAKAKEEKDKQMGKDLQKQTDKQRQGELNEADKIHGGPDKNGNTPTGSTQEVIYRNAQRVFSELHNKLENGEFLTKEQRDALNDAERILAGNY